MGNARAEVLIKEIGKSARVRDYPNSDLLVVHSMDRPREATIFKSSTLEEIAKYELDQDNKLLDFVLDIPNRRFLAVSDKGFVTESFRKGLVSCKAHPLGNGEPVSGAVLAASGKRVITYVDDSASIWDVDRHALVGKVTLENNSKVLAVIATFDSDHALIIGDSSACWVELASGNKSSKHFPIEATGALGKTSLTGRYYALPGKSKIYLFDQKSRQVDFVDWNPESADPNAHAFTGRDQYFLCQQGESKRYAIDAWQLEDGIQSLTFKMPIFGASGDSFGTSPLSAMITFHGVEPDNDQKAIQLRSLTGDTAVSFGKSILARPNSAEIKVTAIGISKSERWMGLATEVGQVILWDLLSPRVQINLTSEDGQGVKVEPIKSGGVRGTLSMIDVASIEFLANDSLMFIKCNKEVCSLVKTDSFPDDELLSVDLGRRSANEKRFYLTKSEIKKLSFSHDGQKLFAVDNSNALILDLSNGCEVLYHSGDSTLGGWFTTDGHSVYMVRSNGPVWLDLRTKRLRQAAQLGNPTGQLTGNLIPGIILGDKMSVLDVESGQVAALVTMTTVNRGLTDLSDDNTLLVSGGSLIKGGGIGLEIVDLLTGKATTSMKIDSDGLYGVAFLADKSRVAVLGANSVRVFDYRRNRMSAEFAKANESRPQPIRRSSSVTAAAANSWYDDVASSDLILGSRILRAMDYHPSTGRIAISKAQKVEVWDAAKEEMVWSSVLDGDSVSELVFSPDGKRLAAGMYDGCIRVISLVSK
jgi:WD40 repeat protein